MTRRPRQPDGASAISQTPFDAQIDAHGWCAVCRHREESRHHRAAHCKGEYRRQHPRCTSDGKRPRFEPDMVVISEMKEGGIECGK